MLSEMRGCLNVNLQLFFSDFGKYNPQISNFMNIRPLGTELLHADGRTDRQDGKVIVAFRYLICDQFRIRQKTLGCSARNVGMINLILHKVTAGP